MWTLRRGLAPGLGGHPIPARAEGAGRRGRGRRATGGDGAARRPAAWAALFFASALAGVAGCKPSIGSRCTLSTDCSTQGDRVCDTAQSEGYCTVLDCTQNACPDNAVCVLFQASVPGCTYSDYSSPARTSQAMCMKDCGGDSDCRQEDGYVCASPLGSPWYAAILDDNQEQTICITAVASSAVPPPPSDTGVCSLSLPPLPDAGGGPAAGKAFDGGAGDGSDGSDDAAGEDSPDVADAD